MFKHVYTGFAVGSTILGITGLMQSWKTEEITRTLALTVGVGGTASALVTVGLGIAYDGKNRTLQSDYDEQVKEIERVNTGKVNGLQLEIKNLQSQLKILESRGLEYVEEANELRIELNLKAEQFLKIVAEKDLKISQLQNVVDTRDTRIEDFLEDCRGYTTNFFNLRYQNLDGLQRSLESALENDKLTDATKQSFKNRISDINALKADLNDVITELKGLSITNFQDVLGYIFTFDNKFLNVKTRWKDGKTQTYKDETIKLKNELDNSMPKPVALERFNEGLDEVDAKITEKYEALLLNNNSIHAQLLDLLDQRNLVIAELQRENEELHAVVDNPFKMYGQSHYAETANKVAAFYNTLLGKKLDCVDWEETESGFKLIFSMRRNPNITLNELKEGDSLEQIAALTNALDGSIPEFAIHSHNATVSLVIQRRRPPKSKPPTIDDIFRECGVIRADLFGSTVRKYHIDKTGKPTLRVMSATGGGKGIAVKNLIDHYLKNVDGYEIWLSDPQDGSEEDHWDCEKAATDPATASALFNRFASLLRSRDAKTSTEPTTPIIGVFDEFDKKHPVDDKLTASQIWTTIRHHSMRLILIGQSGEVGKNKWTWDEMTNCCLLFISDAIPTFLKHADKDLQMNPVKLKNFSDAYNKVKIYIDDANQDIEPENQYRLAALYCNGNALLLEIPPAHKGVLCDGKSWLVSEPFTKNQGEMPVKQFTEIKQTLSCPHCDSLNLIKKGKDNKNQQLYSCKECSNSPQKFIPNINAVNVEE